MDKLTHKVMQAERMRRTAERDAEAERHSFDVFQARMTGRDEGRRAVEVNLLQVPEDYVEHLREVAAIKFAEKMADHYEQQARVPFPVFAEVTRQYMGGYHAGDLRETVRHVLNYSVDRREWASEIRIPEMRLSLAMDPGELNAHRVRAGSGYS